ncbi:MAG: succinate dehydrogenase [Acidilobaceae archaeon]
MSVKDRFLGRTLDNRLGLKASVSPWAVRAPNNPERLAFILHRITGVLLASFITLHVITTNTPARAGWEAWVEEIERLSGVNIISLMFFMVMGALAFHSINGIRLLLVEFLAIGIGRPEKPKPPYTPPSFKGFQRPLIYIAFALSIIVWITMGYVMFLMG